MIRPDRQTAPSVNSGSMADMAFLLLIFFMLTTTIIDNKGLFLVLPPAKENQTIAEVHDRNVFNISINSQDKLLIENTPRENIAELKSEIKEFVLNRGRRPDLSDSPQKAVVSLKTSRNTSYSVYILVLDEIIGSYNEIYAERAGMTPEDFKRLDPANYDHALIIKKAKEGIPRSVSIAEPGI